MRITTTAAPDNSHRPTVSTIKPSELAPGTAPEIYPARACLGPVIHSRCNCYSPAQDYPKSFLNCTTTFCTELISHDRQICEKNRRPGKKTSVTQPQSSRIPGLTIDDLTMEEVEELVKECNCKSEMELNDAEMTQLGHFLSAEIFSRIVGVLYQKGKETTPEDLIEDLSDDKGLLTIFNKINVILTNETAIKAKLDRLAELVDKIEKNAEQFGFTLDGSSAEPVRHPKECRKDNDQHIALQNELIKSDQEIIATQKESMATMQKQISLMEEQQRTSNKLIALEKDLVARYKAVIDEDAQIIKEYQRILSNLSTAFANLQKFDQQF